MVVPILLWCSFIALLVYIVKTVYQKESSMARVERRLRKYRATIPEVPR
jgi:hypothetical protein